MANIAFYDPPRRLLRTAIGPRTWLRLLWPRRQPKADGLEIRSTTASHFDRWASLYVRHTL